MNSMDRTFRGIFGSYEKTETYMKVNFTYFQSKNTAIFIFKESEILHAIVMIYELHTTSS